MKSMQVSVYCQKHVEPEYQLRFYQLLREWDGRNDVAGAFYDMDVLVMKHEEAQGK